MLRRMEGIRFLTDDKGHRFVELDLERYGEQWEDFYDALVVRQRLHEKRESWETVKKRLVRAGKLRA